MKYRKCEICGLKTERKDGKKRYFMARFPLDAVRSSVFSSFFTFRLLYSYEIHYNESITKKLQEVKRRCRAFLASKNTKERCKQWVKVTGNEDLVYVPIEKLHDNKFVCGKHFVDNDFKEKKTQLKNTAVPTLELTARPLPDEILTHFPCHIYSVDYLSMRGKRIIKNVKDLDEYKRNCTLKRINDHNYCKDISSEVNYDVPASDPEQTQEAGDEPACEPLDTEEPEEPAQVDGPFTWQQPSEAVICITDTQEEDLIENELKTNDEIDELVGPPEESLSLSPEDETSARYQCNACERPITGCRYVCVQCTDWDLCGACEAAGAHHAHYVLRVPQGQNKNEVELVLQSIRRALADSIVLINEEDIKVEGEIDQEDPIAVESGDPYTEDLGGPIAAESELDSIDMDDTHFYSVKSAAAREKTDPPKQARNEPSRLTLLLEPTARGYNASTSSNCSNNGTQKFQLQETYKNTSVTNVVTLPAVCDNASNTSLVTLHDQCLSEMYVETSSVSVPVLGRFVTPRAGTKRRVAEIVPGMTAPERKKVPMVHLNRLTKEAINLYLKVDKDNAVKLKRYRLNI